MTNDFQLSYQFFFVLSVFFVFEIVTFFFLHREEW